MISLQVFSVKGLSSPENGVFLNTTSYIIFYVDIDGDGFGDPNTTIDAASAPLGYVSNGDGCNDTDSSFNPDATDICDGFDNNCDG